MKDNTHDYICIHICAHEYTHTSTHIHTSTHTYTRINAYTGFSGVLPVVLLSKLKSDYYLEPVDDTRLKSLMQGGSTLVWTHLPIIYGLCLKELIEV